MHPSCPDFDLCSDCEALPIPVHPLNHPMLKLRTADTVVPTVCRIGQMRAIDEPPRQQPPLVCSEPLVSPPLSPLATQTTSPNAISVAVSDQGINAAAEGQAHFTEEFLSPLGSPTSDLSRDTSVNCVPSHLVNVAELLESPQSSPSPLDIHRQLWPSANPELMHLDAAQAPKAGNPVVNVAQAMEPVAREPLLPEAPLAASVASSISLVGDLMRPVSPVSSTTKSIFDGYCTPPPVLSNNQELHDIAQQLPSENRQDIATFDAPQQSYLDSAFVGDTNVPDGQVFPPGAEFVKGWHIMNNGRLPWPTTTEVQFVAGETFAPERSASLRATVGVVHPGQDLDIWTGDLKVSATIKRWRRSCT